MSTTTAKVVESSVQTFIAVKNAFDECAPEIKSVVSEMLAIYNDRESSPREKQLAINTIIEAIFPASCADLLESEREFSETPKAKARAAEMEQEEELFAQRVREHMDKLGMKQEELAKAIGVSQPAIANLLNRTCRPQKRTVTRMAEALGVDPGELWPSVAVSK